MLTDAVAQLLGAQHVGGRVSHEPGTRCGSSICQRQLTACRAGCTVPSVTEERPGYEVLASNLHRLVFERGTTLDEVARAAGLTREQLDAICSGKLDPDLDVVYRIAEAVGVMASELLAEPEYN